MKVPKILPIVVILVGFFSIPIAIEIARPESKVPWWYNDSQVGWDHDHRKTPVGYDDISQYFINSHGMHYIPWKKDEMWSYSGLASRRHQWIGDKLLVRTVDGEEGFFSGGGHVHPPLTEDPAESEKTLKDCLAANDNGKLPEKPFKEHPSVVEMIEASGATVKRD